MAGESDDEQEDNNDDDDSDDEISTSLPFDSFGLAVDVTGHAVGFSESQATIGTGSSSIHLIKSSAVIALALGVQGVLSGAKISKSYIDRSISPNNSFTRCCCGCDCLGGSIDSATESSLLTC